MPSWGNAAAWGSSAALLPCVVCTNMTRTSGQQAIWCLFSPRRGECDSLRLLPLTMAGARSAPVRWAYKRVRRRSSAASYAAARTIRAHYLFHNTTMEPEPYLGCCCHHPDRQMLVCTCFAPGSIVHTMCPSHYRPLLWLGAEVNAGIFPVLAAGAGCSGHLGGHHHALCFCSGGAEMAS